MKDATCPVFFAKKKRRTSPKRHVSRTFQDAWPRLFLNSPVQGNPSSRCLLAAATPGTGASGHGSIPTPFLEGWTSIYQLFLCFHQRATRFWPIKWGSGHCFEKFHGSAQIIPSFVWTNGLPEISTVDWSTLLLQGMLGYIILAHVIFVYLYICFSHITSCCVKDRQSTPASVQINILTWFHGNGYACPHCQPGRCVYFFPWKVCNQWQAGAQGASIERKEGRKEEREKGMKERKRTKK